MGKHRNPADLLAEMKEREIKILAKLAKDEADQDPAVMELLDEKAQIEKRNINFNRWLDPEEGSAVQIEKFHTRIAEHEARIQEASTQRPANNQRIAELNKQIQVKRAEVAKSIMAEAQEQGEV